jgi:superfamily II DNA or RNA helicase
MTSQTKTQIQPGDWLRGPFWPTAVQVVSIQERTDKHITLVVHARGQTQSRAYVVPRHDLDKIEQAIPADRRRITFEGDAVRFRLGLEAHRLRLAHSIDPYAALNASRIDPLPHQFEAVYQHLLARPVVRALLAHDAGAGKTIMAGMLLKELKRRQGVKRVLIVAPAGLTWQWRRELLTKFGEQFEVVDRDFIRQNRFDRLNVWRETDFAITSVAYVRQPILRQVLESVEWDMVIVDEAHSMAAYKRPNGSIRRTHAYQLGEVLSRRSLHFLLMTATPHKGDPDNYRLLLNLIDEQWGEASSYVPDANPIVLRRTKEEMRKANGDPLYPQRIVETLPYNLSHQEGELLEQIQKFIRERYAKAKAANQQSAVFALITLERRLASSPYAMRESLRRMRQSVSQRLQNVRRQLAVDNNQEDDWLEWEDLSEQDRWELERAAEVSVAQIANPRKLKEELRQIDVLIARSEAIMQHGEQEKIAQLRQACQHWVQGQAEQLIIFTEFKDTLDHLVARLHEWGYTTTEIHGGKNVAERRQAEREFWNGEAQILVATEAAGEGINLQCCRTMINFDLPWNPCRLEQRMGRIHRYGQQADQVFIFNLLAQNSIEDQVKEAIIKKQKQMKADLGDKVFDVVGQVLWGSELRDILERIALGDATARQEALDLIEGAETAVTSAWLAENQATIMNKPLDVTAFQRERATFAANRLSPEVAETFFREAVPLVDGMLQEEMVAAPNGRSYPVFTITLPPDFPAPVRPRKLRFSFWSPVCADDETAVNAIFFLAPGHWLLEALIERVMQLCQPDMNKGALYFDIDPEGTNPYLVWFVQTHIRDGLDRRLGDLLAAVAHHADEEKVKPLPTEILHGFNQVVGPQELGQQELGRQKLSQQMLAHEPGDSLRQVMPMLAGQDEVLNQCVDEIFLPRLAEKRGQQAATLARDRQFLSQGLTNLAEHLSQAALDAYEEGDEETGEQLTSQSYTAEKRLAELSREMDLAEQLLLVAPDVLGVALVLPKPVEISVPKADGAVGTIQMRRDPAVEQAAMAIVRAYEERQGRYPRDVSQGKSWDIESDDAHGVPVRFIEVKGRGPKEANEVMITEPEWQAARRLEEKHWLYIVRLEDGMMWLIQNPYAKLQPKELKRWLVRVPDAIPHAQTVVLDETPHL